MKIFSKINMMLVAGVLALSSCGNDWLDTTPYNAADASSAIQTVSDLANVRVGMYQALKGNSSMIDYYSRLMFVYGDVRGEDVQANHIDGSGRANFYYYMTYKTADDFTTSTAVWESPFVVISRANQIIEYSKNVSDAEDNKEELDMYVAEAKVLRAMATFDLTRIYGKPYTQDNGASLGAPIVTEVLSSTAKPLRSTVAECYTQIIKDLTEAINSEALYLKPDADFDGYITEVGAKALLARVYLTKGDWANALSTASDIIENSDCNLWTPDVYADAWSKNSASHFDEMLFEIAITGTTDWTDREGIAYVMAEESDRTPGYCDMIVTKQFSDLMVSDPQDVRNQILLTSVKDASRGDQYFAGRGVYINKMPAIGGDVRYSNVPMLRLSEVYLIAAEAAFNTGDKVAAADYLNALIRNRTTDTSKLLATDGSNITYDRIKMERRKELVGEGQRYFDILRTGDTVKRYTDATDKGWNDALTEEARTISRDSKKALPLIPVGEINANSNMQQNPLY